MSKDDLEINLNRIFRGIFSYYKIIFSSIIIAFVFVIFYFNIKPNEVKLELHLFSETLAKYEKFSKNFGKKDFNIFKFIDNYKKSFQTNFFYEKHLNNYLDKNYKDISVSYFYSFKEMPLNSYFKKNKITFNFEPQNKQKFSKSNNSNYLFSITMNFPSELDSKEFIINYIKFIHEITYKEFLNNLYGYLEVIQNLISTADTLTEMKNNLDDNKLYLMNLLLEEDLMSSFIPFLEKDLNNKNINELYEFSFLINEFSKLSHIIRSIILVLFISILLSFLIIYFHQNIKIKI